MNDPCVRKQSADLPGIVCIWSRAIAPNPLSRRERVALEYRAKKRRQRRLGRACDPALNDAEVQSIFGHALVAKKMVEDSVSNRLVAEIRIAVPIRKFDDEMRRAGNGYLTVAGKHGAKERAA